MCSLDLKSASALLRQFERDWNNLRDDKKDQPEELPTMTKKLALLCGIRRKLCRDRRLLRWYLLEGLQNISLFQPATMACAEWEDKTIDEINLHRFKNYNNWTLTTTARWRLLQEAFGRERYDRWNFKHPLPPSIEILHEIMATDSPGPTLLRINGVTHDLEWYNCM